MAIHQLLHTLSYGDAISGEVLALKRVLEGAGVSSEIFAFNVHPKLKGVAQEISVDSPELSFDEGDTIILHYSLGSPLNEIYQECSNQRRILIYHNITPAHWFRSINSRVYSDIGKGIADLPVMCRASDLILADSPFNQAELAQLGFASEVLELPIDPERWSVEANPGILSLLRGRSATNILHVGRLAPNKCVEDILKFFYFLHHFGRKSSQLWLVGIDTDTELYSFSLKRLAYELGIEDAVHFTGPVADEELRAFYTCADLYICMSEHEGFCLPVVEAMHFGVPVMAYRAGALPETIGTAGILFSEKRHAELAEVALEVLQRQQLYSELQEAGRQRVTQLSFENFASRVKSLVLAEPALVVG
jgi:glycosyltransferase involved in cell wall biosynthesis